MCVWAAQLHVLCNVTFTQTEIEALPLAERWVVSKAHKLVNQVTKAYNKYDFGEAGRASYDFFWNEFADWYIELSKSRLYGDDEELQLQTKRVLVYVYDLCLRVLHPSIPFVTEELWQAIPHEGASISLAAWPAADQFVDEEAVVNFDALQALVRSIRNVRAEYNVELGRKVPAIIIASPQFQAALQQEGDIVSKLATLDPEAVQVVGTQETLDDSIEGVRAVVLNGLEVFLPLAGLADPEKEVRWIRIPERRMLASVRASLLHLCASPYALAVRQKLLWKCCARTKAFSEDPTRSKSTAPQLKSRDEPSAACTRVRGARRLLGWI